LETFNKLLGQQHCRTWTERQKLCLCHLFCTIIIITIF